MVRLINSFLVAAIIMLLFPLTILSQTAQVGNDQEVCTTSTTISAITPNGVWSTTGGATIISPSNVSTIVNNLDQGVNTFTYTVSGLLPGTLTVTNNTIIANANEQLPDTCSNTSTIIGSSTPVVPSGQWSLIFADDNIIIDNTAAITTSVSNLPFGTTTLVWTVNNGNCSDNIELDITKNLPENSLGSDQTGCTNTFYIGASAPPIGGSGLWTDEGGTGVIFDDENSSGVEIIAPSGVSDVRWTITYNTCNSTKDFIITNNLPVPNAGIDISTCVDDITLAADALQPGESGKWTVVGPQEEIFTNTADPGTSVSNVKQGTTTFEWTVTNAFCSASDLMQVVNNRPTVDAGPDDIICTSDYTLNANNPLPHTGTWNSNPPVTFNNVNQYNATISGMENDVYTLTWTVDNGDCMASDEVIITSDFVTITAGVDQNKCSSTFTLTGTEIPSGGSGYWSRTYGTGVIANSLSATTTASDVDEISRFRWTIISGGCNYTDEVQLNNQLPSQASTNPDKDVCSNSTTIVASPPVDQNEAGIWSDEGGGSAEIIDPSLFQTQVNNLQSGINTFRWTIYNQNCITYDLIEITNNTITADAGEDDVICSTSTNLNADLPAGTGYWMCSNPSVVIANSTDPGTAVSNLSFGENTFTWTRQDQGCMASDQVIITSDLPVNVFAGSDQVICVNQTDLNADNPTHGAGAWSIASGGGDIANINLYQTEVTNVNLGTNVFRWTVTYNACSSYADVEVSNQRIVMDAGPDHVICNTTSTTLAGTEPIGLQAGNWTVIGGNGVFANETVFNTTVDGLLIGINTFQWTLDDGVCSNSAEVIITNNTPDAAQVGDAQTICTDHTIIGAVEVQNGVGSWSISSGVGIIDNSLDNNTNVSSIGLGINTFTWTVTKNSCSRMADIIVTNNSVVANITTAEGSICAPSHSTTLLAEDPGLIGASGVWTKLSMGTGTIESPSNFETIISDLANGENNFRWTVQNADCVDFDEISIVNDYYMATAAPVGSPAICENYLGIIGNAAPPSGIGRWTANQAGVIFDNSTSGNTYARDLPSGITTITWTIENNNCFAPTSFDVTNNTLTVSAGDNIVGCENEQVLDADALAGGQTGYWVASNIDVLFDDSTNPTTTARNIPMGSSQLTWTITENGCFASDDMTLINNAFLVTAGADQILCGATYTLQGSDPLITGDGNWTVVQGDGTIENPNEFTTNVSDLPNGENIFRWTVTRNSCVASDEVSLTNDLYIAEAVAPSAVCIDEVDVSAQALPGGSGAVGVWTTLHGGGVFNDVSAYEATVTGLSMGSNRFRWTVTKGSCESYQDVEVMDNRVVVSAGTSKSVCEDYTELFASSLGDGETGFWTCEHGDVIISNPSNSYTGVSGLRRGTNDFTWTVNSEGCVGENTITITNNDFDAYAGTDQEIIVSTTSMSAELPSGAVGDWTIFTGVGVFDDDNSPTTSVSFIGYGYNTYRWTINWNGCISSDDVVVIYNVAEADAGSDQISCNDYATLNANDPGLGTGQWTVESGSGTFANPAQYNTTITNVGRGDNVYRWTVTAFEASAFDEVTITNNSFDIYAGEDIQTCAESVELNAEEPGSGVGVWSVIQGSGTFSNNYQYNATVTNPLVGTNRYVWYVTRNGCNAKDTVMVLHYQPVTEANAGNDVQLCDDDEYYLNSNQPTYGVGVWSTNSGDATIDAPENYATYVRNLPEGETTLYWTISNEHCQSVDEIIVASWYTVNIADNPGSQQLNEGENAQFTVQTTGSVETYQWQKDEVDISNGGRISGVNEANLIISSVIPEDIAYYRCVVNGYCNRVISYGAPLTVTATGLEDISNTEIKLYPNPSNGIVYLEHGESDKIESLHIYDLSGKKIFEKRNLAKKEIVDLSNNREGTYLVIINLGDKFIQNKLIIRK